MPDELERIRQDVSARVHRDTYQAHREGAAQQMAALSSRIDALAQTIERLRADAEIDLSRAVEDLRRPVADLRSEFAAYRKDQADADTARTNEAQRRRQWLIGAIVVPSILALAALVVPLLRLPPGGASSSP